jgi:hypothetical protein
MKPKRGRPRVKKSAKHINVGFSMAPDTRALLEAVCERTGLNRGKVLEQLLKGSNAETK